MSPDIHWLIDGTLANALTSQLPTLIRGQEETLRFQFTAESSDTSSTYGNGGYGEGSYGGDVGGRPADRYQTLYDYVQFANGATVSTFFTDTGVPQFYESLPARADVTSLVVEVEPSDELARATGFWGLVMGGRDVTPSSQVALQLELSLYVLAEQDEYDSKQAVIDDLGASVV